MNLQDLKNVLEESKLKEDEYRLTHVGLQESYLFYGNQYAFLFNKIKEYIEDNSCELEVAEMEQTINLSLTYDELSNLLDLIEYGLIQKGLDSVEDDTKKLYYSLVNTWGEHAGCENDN